MPFDMNAGPLSDCMDLGSPNLGKMSFMGWEQTTSSVSVMGGRLVPIPTKCLPYKKIFMFFF